MLCGLQAIHPAPLRCNENKKKNLCALVEDSKSEATFRQYKNNISAYKTHETYLNKWEVLLKISSPSHLPPY